MAKGSQLSQLKAALSQAGVTGNQNKGKKRKRSALPAEKDKAKKAARLDEIHRKLNPFDVKVTKLKHDVGGRNIKGATGKPAQSKQAGIEQRKKTLLKEYEEKNHAGGIVDRRFGENDPTMSLEERMLERFTRLRQRAAKGAAFNLEDEDELTHYGQSLSNLDDFDNVGLGLDDAEDEESGQIAKDIVRKTHFGGFGDEEEGEEEEEEPARKKTKAEVMSEVIAKSKEHKLLRQMEREKGDNIRLKLDQDFDSLRHLLYSAVPSVDDATSVGQAVAQQRGLESKAEAAILATTVEDQLIVASQDKDYDHHVQELAFDKRSKPKDRTKTEEELALEEKEALEKAEHRRRKRMLGLDESDSEDEGKEKKRRKRGGDDLEDDFESEGDVWGGLGAGLEGAVDSRGDNHSDVSADEEEQESEGEEEGEVEGEESEEEEEYEEDELEDEADGEKGEQEELVTTSKNKRRKANEKQPSKNELPYTFPCPETHDDFLEIVQDVEDKDVPIVVQRIRSLYHISLAPENKLKLQALTTVLIDHILYITAPPTPRLTLLSSLIPHLVVLTKAYPIQSAEYFVKKLTLMQRNLKYGLSEGSLNLHAKTWPSLPELSFFRIIGTLWPTSDLNHAVISPTRILMGSYLGLCRVRSLADLACGLFLCTLYLQYESLSTRFVPEAVNFVINTVLHLAPHGYKSASALPGSFPSPDLGSDLCRPLSIDPKSGKMVNPRKADLSTLLSTETPSEQSKADLLGLALELLNRFAAMYKGLDGFIELYEPILEVIQNIHTKKLCGGLQSRIDSLRDMLGRLLKFSRQSRQPLQLQAHKPIPIPTWIPKFESSSSSYMRRRDPDHERNEAAKLRNQYKQERKGAIRELRKDAKFLAGVELQKQLEKDRSYKERMKRVFGSIESERAEEKAMEREKMKEKRRAGRK
ncbi:hypothetical protein AX17_002078 [Amanita inopinata Kibby_2008]|nr:hypothetical protein AX17_002078 [Amanita inopinata Kibby_2008]